jgi:tripartite-type tricarboxylate transporter receptor subunit TctC
MRTLEISRRLAVLVLGIAATGAAWTAPSLAQNPPPGASTNDWDVIVGMPTGGSIDAYARLLQKHLPRHLAGAPALVVKNKPGAGSLLAVQTIANSTAHDGPMMATFSSALIPGAITDPERFKVDFRHLRFIGNIGEDYRVCYFRSATGIHNMKDLAARDQVIIGASAPGSSGMVNVAVLEGPFKIKVKEVRGYPGSADKRLAIERGEIDGDCGGIDVIPEDWLAQKKVNVAVRFLSHLPAGVDPSIQFAGDLLASPADRQVYDLAIKPTRLVGTFVVSESVPNDKLQELRRGFDQMMTDDAFLEDAQKARLPILAIPGADLDREIAALYATAPDLLKRTKALLDR